MFGILTWSAIQHNAIITGAQVFMGLLVFSMIALLTYYKRWKWLWTEWLTTVDPKKIGIMYILVSFLMLVRGLTDASMVRLQQAISVGSNPGYLGANHFQQIISSHGTIMIFFVAMGLMFGIINLIVPLQIGARDVAFPFLNATSFWLFVAGMVLINVSLAVGEFSATGWLAYPPLSELQYSPGVGVDYWIWSLQIAGIGSLLSGVNFLTTIAKMRRKGMSLMRMPIFTWTVFAAMALVVLAFPVLTGTLLMLSLDRLMGMHFFTAGNGGNMMMYVNLIWSWGHPEVYILALPGFGIFSEIVPVFSQKKLFGYTSMVYATISIAVLSFGVWLHHFFTMGAGSDVNAFFGIMTAIIAIPTGVKIFNWIFTMFRGRILFASPMLWFLGFVACFTIGGMAGMLLSIPGADFQLHNSLFLVAHFHTMIVSGVLFGYFAGLTYWFPKIFGFKLDERTGKLAFWFWLVGFLTAFIPLYVLGFMGATRRLDHYDPSMGWQSMFVIAGVGVVIIIAGVAMQVTQLIISIRNRKQNLDSTSDPWNGRTLEWSTSSPPPAYNFATIPEVYGRDAFWEEKQSRFTDLPQAHYEDIVMPKNTPFAMFIAAAAFIFGFAIVWHIFWLAAVAILGLVLLIIIRSFNEHTTYIIPAAEVARLDAGVRHS